jgi:hypothetical protein
MTDRQADLIKAIHGILGEEGLSDEEAVKRIRACLYGDVPPDPDAPDLNVALPKPAANLS